MSILYPGRDRAWRIVGRVSLVGAVVAALGVTWWQVGTKAFGDLMVILGPVSLLPAILSGIVAVRRGKKAIFRVAFGLGLGWAGFLGVLLLDADEPDRADRR